MTSHEGALPAARYSHLPLYIGGVGLGVAGVGVGAGGIAVPLGEVVDVVPAGTLELGLQGVAVVAETPPGMVLATVGETVVAAPGG
jgi:hypothetical protein